MAKEQKYNKARIRQFLQKAFPTTEHLIEFCQDYYDEALPSLGSGMSHRGMTNALFERCHDDQALEALLECCWEWVVEYNKEDVWERFAPFERRGYVPSTSMGIEWHESKEEKFIEALLRFNYGQEVSMFNDFLDTQRAISFLIRGPKRHGQRFLLNKLFRCLPARTSNKLIERSLLRHGGSCRIKFLWYELGKQIGVKKERSLQAITRKIHDNLQSQNVILIFREAGYTHKGYLSQLIREFWHPLLDELTRIEPLPAKTHKLIMFVIDYQGQADLQGVDWIEKFYAHETPYAKRPVKLELSAFSEREVRGWFEYQACPVLPAKLRVKLDIMIKKWLEIKKTGFVPEQILEEICHCCGYDWIEGEDKWFKL
ncbi:MAG: hypothetical protein ACPGWR_18900 [Ardenticatenaceae bacterium]